MTAWPDGMRIKPIIAWPGEQTKVRRYAKFRAAWPLTLGQLKMELRHLAARNITLQVAIAERDFRIDGYPRANAKASHPGIILTFDSRYGSLSYPCDTFTDWQDNLRAIALALEALRKVDRYGVTRRAEQYAGWKALPAGNSDQAGFASADAALRWMRRMAEDLDGRVPPRVLYRTLAKRLHPDVGGGEDDWDRLDSAKQLLEKAKLL